MIGALQWVITIGRFDTSTVETTRTRFRMVPRKGYMERIKIIYGYLSKMRHASIHIGTEEPNYSDKPDIDHDWSHLVYGELTENPAT
jgi:hypothetical protein